VDRVNVSASFTNFKVSSENLIFGYIKDKYSKCSEGVG
jgi:hypothetical protein